MSVSNKIKALLSLKGKDHSGLAAHLGISTQALSNKYFRNSFSAADLIKIAEYCDCPLCFLSDDGNKVVLDSNDINQNRQT